MLKTIFNWFSHRNPAPEAQAPQVHPQNAPYKIEPPVVPVLVGMPEPVKATESDKPAKKPRVKKSVESSTDKAPRSRKKAQ